MNISSWSREYLCVFYPSFILDSCENKKFLGDQRFAGLPNVQSQWKSLHPALSNANLQKKKSEKKKIFFFSQKRETLKPCSEEKVRMTSTPTETNTVLGIAFGNSTTQIAYISRSGVPECIANEDGERQIPSILSYSEGEEYHGGQAKSQLVRNASNTIVSFRDWLGQKYGLKLTTV